jgi:hypothetical protein
MAETSKSNVILQPPRPGMDMNSSEAFSFLYEIWNRSGGYQSAVTDLKGLKASVAELNTLVGINTDDSVQEQIDLKANKKDLGTMADQDADNVAITGGSIIDAAISNTDITIAAGGTSTQIPIGGTLTVDTTAVGNVGAGEDTLIAYSLTADTLSVNKDYIDIQAWGITAANANNKRIKLKFGSTTILDTGSVAANNASWLINCKIVRTASNAQQIIASIISDSTLIGDSATFTSGTEDLTTSLNIFCTGEATTDDDIVQEGLSIKWFKGE